MCKLLRDYPEQVFLGRDDEGNGYYLQRPKWDCGWYWGFGGLWVYEADNEVDPVGWTHLDTVGNGRPDCAGKNYYKVLDTVFGGSAGGVNDMANAGKLWEFCDVVRTIYTLRQTAEVLGRGGSHYCSNPVFSDVVINTAEVERINNVVIPMLIDAMYVMLGVIEPVSSEVLFEILEEASDEN